MYIFSRAILALVLIGLLVLVTAGPGIISSFTGGNAYNRNGYDYYEYVLTYNFANLIILVFVDFIEHTKSLVTI